MSFKLGKFEVVNHVGSGGSAAVVRSAGVGKDSQELALKFFDPRFVGDDAIEKEKTKSDHPNLVGAVELLTLSALGLEQVPDWYHTILNCDPDEPFVSHLVTSCSPSPNVPNVRKIGSGPFGFQTDRQNKPLSEFAPAAFSILVMEYAPTRLAEYLGSVSLSMKEILRILTDVCAGLTALHDKGVLHGDLGAHNIVLTDKGVAKLIDFGWSQQFEGEGDHFDFDVDIQGLGQLAFNLLTNKDLDDYDGMEDEEIIAQLNIQNTFLDICKQAATKGSWAYSRPGDFLEALTNLDS